MQRLLHRIYRHPPAHRHHLTAPSLHSCVSAIHAASNLQGDKGAAMDTDQTAAQGAAGNQAAPSAAHDPLALTLQPPLPAALQQIDAAGDAAHHDAAAVFLAQHGAAAPLVGPQEPSGAARSGGRKGGGSSGSKKAKASNEQRSELRCVRVCVRVRAACMCA